VRLDNRLEPLPVLLCQKPADRALGQLSERFIGRCKDGEGASAFEHVDHARSLEHSQKAVESAHVFSRLDDVTGLGCPGSERQARGSFEYAGILFEEYRGRVGSVDFTDASKAYFFPVGVPGLFRQYNAPADFVETANTIGLPRYAKQAVDQQFARWVMLHVQSNPLPICTRPRVLIKGKRT
jgi:hypothetical protein